MKINTYAVNCNDAWLNTEGDDISGSYVKYKDHQNVVAELEAKCAALAAEMKQSQIDAGCYKKGMEASNERLVQVAAENAALAAEVQSVKAMNDCLSEELRGYESDGAFEGPKMHLLWWKVQTPATDAFMAEVRNEAGARAVELFAQTLGSPYAVRDEKCYEDGFTRAIEIVRGAQAPRFAAQLRKGGAA